MITKELKDAFLTEHTRDKKLTITNYILIIAFILVIWGVLRYFGVSLASIFEGFGNTARGEYGWSLKLIIPIVIGCGIGYPVHKILQLNKRPAKVEELIKKIEAGERAISVDEYVEHKITLPLGKVTVKLCPVNYVMVNIEGDFKSYVLPLNSGYVPTLRTALSGVNVADINKVKEELYNSTKGDRTAEESAPITPIKTVDEFKVFMKDELSEKIEAIEKTRKNGRKTGTILAIVSVLCVVGFLAYMYLNVFSEALSGENPADNFPLTSILPVFGVIVLVSIVWSLYSRAKYKKAEAAGTLSAVTSSDFTFKTQVFEKILNFASPSSQYVMHGHVDFGELMESGLFIEKNYKITGNDLILGKHSGVPFQFCDLTLSYQKQYHKEGESPDYALYGQFFTAQFNKSFASPIYIVPRTGLKGFFAGNAIDSYTNTSGEKIELEDPEFTKMFNVYGANQIEARYVITPALMERIKELAKRTKGQYYIAFYNNKISVANNSGKNNFEVKSSKSLTKNDSQMVVDFYQDLCDQFSIIDDLKLNVKIWK